MTTNPSDLVPLLQNTAAYIREIQTLLQQQGVRCWTGPLPSG
ncbi:MAG: hypothetical protein AB7O97_00165 [Planctomycetota bacterium]